MQKVKKDAEHQVLGDYLFPMKFSVYMRKEGRKEIILVEYLLETNIYVYRSG